MPRRLRREPAVEKDRRRGENQIFDLEHRHGPKPPRRPLGFFAVLDDRAVAQKRHPIFLAKIRVQKIAVRLAIVPAVAVIAKV
jgi:hypothetical protein